MLCPTKRSIEMTEPVRAMNFFKNKRWVVNMAAIDLEVSTLWISHMYLEDGLFKRYIYLKFPEFGEAVQKV